MKRPGWSIAVAAVLLAGCSDGGDPPTTEDPVVEHCPWGRNTTLYLGPGLGLYEAPQESGRTPGNGFDEAFLTNELDEWTFGPVEQTFRLTGNLTLEYWAQGNNMPAPIIIGGEPGTGYHFFNQVGTDRGLIESYAVEYESALGGTEVRRYVQGLAMPDGGLIVEAGDTLRLLLTNLVLDDPQGGRGPDILWGGDRPSSILFHAACEPTALWEALDEQTADLSVPIHQGLLTGAIPATAGVNYQDVPFTLHDATDRLSILMEQTGGPNPVKDDVDITVLAPNGTSAWSIGSPYTDEVGTLWRANLDAMMPPGDYTVRVNSYSGHGYEGRLTITQETQA